MINQQKIEKEVENKIKNDDRNGVFEKAEGCSGCGTLDIKDEGELCPECEAEKREFEADKYREEAIEEDYQKASDFAKEMDDEYERTKDVS